MAGEKLYFPYRCLIFLILRTNHLMRLLWRLFLHGNRTGVLISTLLSFVLRL